MSANTLQAVSVVGTVSAYSALSRVCAASGLPAAPFNGDLLIGFASKGAKNPARADSSFRWYGNPSAMHALAPSCTTIWSLARMSRSAYATVNVNVRPRCAIGAPPPPPAPAARMHPMLTHPAPPPPPQDLGLPAVATLFVARVTADKMPSIAKLRLCAPVPWVGGGERKEWGGSGEDGEESE